MAARVGPSMVDRRKNPRFAINQLAALKLPGGGTSSNLHATVCDVCAQGALLSTAAPIPRDTEVEVTLLMPQNVYTSAKGRVVRVEKNGSDDSFAIAVECRGCFSDPR